MKAPDFWGKSKWHPMALLLAPLGGLYGRIGARRLKRGAWAKVDVPVICVGNINAGGVGKTPTVIALAGFLAECGHQPHVVSRGYGGRETGPLQVNEMAHNAAQVGDEPLLMAAFAPTWVAKDRLAGAQAAIAAGADVILLDDGFQNPALYKDMALIVVDAAVGFGNGRVLPAGPLREPVATGLARGAAIVSIGTAKAQAALSQRWPMVDDLPRLKAELQPLQMGIDWAEQRVIAFAGIGRPEKFFKSLAQAGAEIVAAHSFADHAPYTAAALQRLLKESHQKGAQLVTTEKDAARLPARFRPEVIAFPVRLVFEEEAKLAALMQGVGLGPKAGK